MGEPHLISWRPSKQNTAVSWGRRDSVSRQGQKSCLNSQTPGPSYRRWLRATPCQVQPAGPPTGVGFASPQNPVSQLLTINLSCFLNLFPVSLPPHIIQPLTLRNLPKRNEGIYSYKDMSMDVHSSFISKSQKLEPPTPLIKTWTDTRMDTQITVCIHPIEYFLAKKGINY